MKMRCVLKIPEATMRRLLPTARVAFGSQFRRFASANGFQLNADHGEPGNVKGVAECFVVLMVHTAVGLVDTDGPNFFSGLAQSEDDIGAVHSRGLLPEQLP